jgi:hypothetical protein
MLQIRINKSFFLNLPDNFSMQFIDENPMFLTDRIPVPHTISLEAPLTPENRVFFGFPDRVTSPRIFDKYTADIIHFGSTIMRGELIILSVKKTIQFQFINATMPQNAKKKLNTLDFGDYDYGQFHATKEDLDYSDSMYAEYKAALYDSINNPTDFITAPVRRSDVEWEGHAATNGLKNAIRQYINYYNPFDSSWSMPNKDNLSAMALFPIVPFPYIHKLIDIFFGNTLDSNPFYDDPTLRKLVMVCFNHKNINIDNYFTVSDNGRIYYCFPLADDYTATAGLAENYTQQKSFMQEYPFSDFLKNLIALFGLTCFIGDKIELVYNNTLINSKIVFDLTPFVSGLPEVSYENPKHYVLTYNQDIADDVDGIDPPIVKNSIKAMYDQILNVISPVLTTNFKLKGTNAVFEFSKVAVGVPPSGQDQRMEVRSVIKSPALATKRAPEEDDIENIIISSDVKPLEMNLEHYWNELSNYAEEAINKENWYVPVLPSTGVESAPHIMLDAGLRTSVSFLGHSFRQLLNHHTDARGNKLFNLSLLISDTDSESVYYKFHQPMSSWYAKSKIKLTLVAILTPTQILSISNQHKIHVSGKNFHIIKREYALSSKKYIPVTFELIEAIN